MLRERYLPNYPTHLPTDPHELVSVFLCVCRVNDNDNEHCGCRSGWLLGWVVGTPDSRFYQDSNEREVRVTYECCLLSLAVQRQCGKKNKCPRVVPRSVCVLLPVSTQSTPEAHPCLPDRSEWMNMLSLKFAKRGCFIDIVLIRFILIFGKARENSDTLSAW